MDSGKLRKELNNNHLINIFGDSIRDYLFQKHQIDRVHNGEKTEAKSNLCIFHLEGDINTQVNYKNENKNENNNNTILLPPTATVGSLRRIVSRQCVWLAVDNLGLRVSDANQWSRLLQPTDDGIEIGDIFNTGEDMNIEIFVI